MSAMHTAAMNARMTAYSTIVAPESSRAKRSMSRIQKRAPACSVSDRDAVLDHRRAVIVPDQSKHVFQHSVLPLQTTATSGKTKAGSVIVTGTPAGAVPSTSGASEPCSCRASRVIAPCTARSDAEDEPARASAEGDIRRASASRCVLWFVHHRIRRQRVQEKNGTLYHDFTTRLLIVDVLTYLSLPLPFFALSMIAFITIVIGIQPCAHAAEAVLPALGQARSACQSCASLGGLP